MHAGKDARRQHGWRVAGAFLVGPVGDDDRMPGLDAEIVERADNFEAAQNAEHAVIFAAGRLRIEMAADIDRQRIRIGALATGEHGAHLVEAHFEPCRLAPFLEEAPALAVLIGQRLPVIAAGNARADLRHLHDGIPETIGIDTQVFAGGGHIVPLIYVQGAARGSRRRPFPCGSMRQSISLSTSRIWSISSLI